MKLKKLKALALLALIPLSSLQAGHADDPDPYVEPDIGLENLCVIPLRIKFNHKSGHDTDAYQIRKNASETFAHSDHTKNGEWTCEGEENGTNSPILYKANANVTVKVKFEAKAYAGETEVTYPFTVKIRALEKWDGTMCNLSEEEVTFTSATSAEIEFTCQSKTHEWDGNTLQDISKVDSKWKWRVRNIVDDSGDKTIGISKHTIYTVLSDGPQDPWDENDPELEPREDALDFALDTVGLSGETSKLEVVNKTTNFVFNYTGMLYSHTDGGVSHYTSVYDEFGFPGGKNFQLTNYIEKDELLVNCFDQAAAVHTFSTLMGSGTEWIKFKKLGFLNDVKIVGFSSGNMNNPFWDATVGLYQFVNSKLVDSNKVGYVCNLTGNPIAVDVDGSGKQTRSYFGIHSAVYYNAGNGDKVHDATLGPKVGTQTPAAYLTNVIDVTSNLYTGGAELYMLGKKASTSDALGNYVLKFE